MTTTVELERNGTFEAIGYSDFEIENGVSDVRIAPEATFTTSNRVPVDSNQRVRIVIDGTTRFKGRTTSQGTRRRNGQRRVRAEHEAYRVFDEAVSVGPSSDPATVLQDTIAETSFAAGLSVEYTGTSETLGDSYDVDNRKVKSIFRDVVDRTNRVWWIDSDGVITVQPRGGRGEWASVSTPGDDAAIDSYEGDDVRSVVNDVTVVGTGEKRVEGSAVDDASIDEYGRRSERFDISYVTSKSEADSAAAELLQPTPLDSASVLLGGSVGTKPDQNLSNYTIRLTDPSFGLSEDSFIIESQTVQQGRVELEVGEAATGGIDSVNRGSKSQQDGPDVGTVIDDEIAQFAVNTPELVDLSITETKVGENAISTPKLQAEAVTANEILANTITAAEIQSLFLETATLEIGVGTDGKIIFEETELPLEPPVFVTQMLPEADGLATIGAPSQRFDSIYGTVVGGDRLETTGHTDVGASLDSLESKVSSLDSRVSSLESSSSSE